MKTLLNSKEVTKTIQKMALEIGKQVSDPDSLVLIGLTTRGVPLAERLSRFFLEKNKAQVSIGTLDITLYRDDLSQLDYHPQVKKTDIPFSLDGKTVFLVDDVLYTGRSIRCALDALFDFGRPHRVGLAVLVDRGGRELPIQADVVGILAQVADKQNVQVKLKEVDGEDGVEIISNPPSPPLSKGG